MVYSRYVTKLEHVAEFFGVTEGSVKTHWRPAMPASCGKPGRWDLMAIGRWLVRTYYSKGKSPDGDVGDSMQKAKLAEQVERAKTARIKRERMEGDLISRVRHTETIMALSGLYAAAIDECESIAAASTSKGREVKIRSQIERVRDRLRERLESISRGEA